MKFIIESSAVPIYNRIATAFAKTLMEFGHTVHFIDASGFNETDFVNTINDIEIDYYISTNELNKIQKKSDSGEYFLFEKINLKKIFIHHDNIFSGLHDLNTITEKLKAFIRNANDSLHFCLEKSNVSMLKTCGILQAFQTYHASEFNADAKHRDFKYGISFVGHLMATLNLYPTETLIAGEHLRSMAWGRYSSSKFQIQPKIKEISENGYIFQKDENKNLIDSFGIQQYLVASLNKLSSAIRGDLIRSIKDKRVDIFGGDLSYGKINNPLLKIDQQNVHYNAATMDHQSTQEIYRDSQINLNFTALQFDTTMNNRCIDVIASGGFLITDAMPDWLDADELSIEIAFNSPEEMHHKINHYLSNKKRYNEVRDALRQSIQKKYTYPKQVSLIIEKLLISKA
jgi:hypothetical protein